ncbi:MAG: hypothetical protein QOI80_892 [Solirubrobacteraceae bacterium]|jgi:hypothetical protein|nr:hypothetical protein [Solirubrobacteraceae bacterium]
MNSSAVIEAPVPASAGPSPARTGLVIGGSVLAVIASILALAGGAVLVLFGSDGKLSSGPEALTTPTTALVSDVGSIEDSAEVADALGTTRVRISADAQTAHGTFVGIGRTADVDRYLAGAAVDTVTDIDVDPFRLTRTTRGGSAHPAAPADQTFWVASSTGAHPDMSWKIADGDYRLVVMNADGSPAVHTRADFEVTVPNLPEIGLGALIIGLLMLAGGIVLIVVGARPARLYSASEKD